MLPPTGGSIAPAAGAASLVCPSGGTPAPGSTITNGLEVSGGDCNLTNVTIQGGITVDAASVSQLACCPTNSANLNGSTVNGGVVVNEGGQVLDGIDSTFTPTNNPSTINGGVTLHKECCYFLVGTTVRGGFTMDGGFDFSPICDGGPFCHLESPLCGAQIYGDVTFRDINVDQFFFGDPNEGFCPGTNVIHGSVFMKDSNFIRFDGEPSEIEGNSVIGSVYIDHSTAEVNGNTIGGSLLCTNGSVIHPPPPPDVAGNTVRGKDTCD